MSSNGHDAYFSDVVGATPEPTVEQHEMAVGRLVQLAEAAEEVVEALQRELAKRRKELGLDAAEKLAKALRARLEEKKQRAVESVRPTALCWRSPLAGETGKAEEHARKAKAAIEALPAHMAAFWEEQKKFELPEEPKSERVRALVDRLKAGEEVEVDKLTWIDWTRQYQQPPHHFRIGGRLVDYNRATGVIALYPEGQ